MQNAASLPTHIPTLHQLLLEQQHMIETLKEQLRLALHRQFGPRNEFVDVDQLGLFAASDDSATVITTADAPEADVTPRNESPVKAARRKAVRILKDLPREVRVIDIPDAEKVCSCCGGELHHFGDDCSEQLGYVPAAVRIIETRRRKYACNHCHGDMKRAKEASPAPLAKSMVSASLIAFLIVSKFADHLPLYRIAQRLERLGVELSHALMSEWLLHCAELLVPLHLRLCDKVRASGHVFTDDTILPLQNSDPARHTTHKSRLWVYSCHHRRQRPLVAYDFSLTRSQQAPLAFLAGYRGYLQADALPGYDVLYARGDITEVACWAHARRKYKDVAVLMKTPGRAHQAIAFIKRLYRIEKQIRQLSDEERLNIRQEKSIPVLNEFKIWLDEQANAVLPKSELGKAMYYTLNNWDALCRYTEAGYLEADNNFAERCMRPVALGRKNFLFVGSERGGKAAAIYYSLIESCKLNQVNPLTYMTYVLSKVRNKNITLLLPDEFDQNNLAEIG